MKLLGSAKNKLTRAKNGKVVPHLEITGEVFTDCNIVNSDYQLDPRVLHTFVLNKLFGQLLNILSNNFMFLKTFNSEF